MKKLLIPLLALCAIAGAQSNINTIALGSNNSIHGLAGTATAITYTVFGSLVTSGNSVYQTLAQGQLGTSDAALYSTPTGSTAFISLIILTNTTGTAATVTLGMNGTASTASNQLLAAVTIPGNGYMHLTSADWTIRDSVGNAAHPAPGYLCGSIVAASAAIVNAQASVVSCALPANAMAAGTTFRVTASGTITTASTPGNDVFKVRIGTTTLTGNVAATITAAATASITAQNFWLEMLVTVRTAGASGTVVGQGYVLGTDVTTGAWTTLNIIGLTTSAVAVDTTAAKLVELTVVTGATDSSVTFQNAAIELVRQ